jgi:hypothetical protein
VRGAHPCVRWRWVTGSALKRNPANGWAVSRAGAIRALNRRRSAIEDVSKSPWSSRPCGQAAGWTAAVGSIAGEHASEPLTGCSAALHHGIKPARPRADLWQHRSPRRGSDRAGILGEHGVPRELFLPFIVVSADCADRCDRRSVGRNCFDNLPSAAIA